MGPPVLRSPAQGSCFLGLSAWPGLGEGRPCATPGSRAWAAAGAGALVGGGSRAWAWAAWQAEQGEPWGPQASGAGAGGGAGGPGQAVPWRLEGQRGCRAWGRTPQAPSVSRAALRAWMCSRRWRRSERAPMGWCIQGQEQGDRAARGPQEDQAGFVSSGTASETPWSRGDPQPTHPSLIIGFCVPLLFRVLPSYTGATEVQPSCVLTPTRLCPWPVGVMGVCRGAQSPIAGEGGGHP